MKPFITKTQPNSPVGVGLRHSHYTQALEDTELNNSIDFVELHAENFFVNGGIAHELLNDIAQKYAISVHGTSLGLGSNLPVPKEVLQQFAQLVALTNAQWVSEHLCFNRAVVNGEVLHSGDLLPLAYNQASLDVLVNNVVQVQDTIKRPILIENLSAYVSASQIDNSAVNEMSEVTFLRALCKQAGCGLLLDINNLIVNALNQKQANIVEHVYGILQQIPAELVGEIHLAGFSDNTVNGFIVDDHANAVSAQCWQLYQKAKELFGNVPTLIEWDNNLPSWDTLVGEAQKARR